jgi:hypothetical protein
MLLRNKLALIFSLKECKKVTSFGGNIPPPWALNTDFSLPTACPHGPKKGHLL